VEVKLEKKTGIRHSAGLAGWPTRKKSDLVFI